MAAEDIQQYPGLGPWGFAGGDGEVYNQIIEDFVTRREVAMEAVQTSEDMAFFTGSLSTWFMRTGRHINTNTIKHTYFQRGSRFKAAAISNVGSPTAGLAVLTIDTAYVYNIGGASPFYVSPGLDREYVFIGKNGVRGQITAVSKPTNSTTHTITVQFEDNTDASSLSNGDKIAFHAITAKELDTYPNGNSQTDARFNILFEYMMTTRPQISMLAASAQKQYGVDGKFFEWLIARTDTYVRHEILKSIECLIADGRIVNGRQTTVGLIPMVRGFGPTNLNTDLSTASAVTEWLRTIVRYARGVGQMGNEMTHMLGYEFKTGTTNVLGNAGLTTAQNIRYDAFGGDAGANERSVKLGFTSVVDQESGFTHHLKPVLEYAHPELMNTTGTYTNLANASFYEKSDLVLSMGKGGSAPNIKNTFGVDGATPDISILNLVMQDGKGGSSTQNHIFRGSDILGYEASTETITEYFSVKMTNAQKGMFFVRTS